MKQNYLHRKIDKNVKINAIIFDSLEGRQKIFNIKKYFEEESKRIRRLI